MANKESMSNLFLSIVTINYNNAEGLRETIESIRSQNFDNYEHIIIDGGSSDGSVDIIKEFLKDPSYARHLSFWCSEKDGGRYNAMNKGIMRSKGQYVATLNSGDCYAADALSGLEEIAAKNPDAVLYGAISVYLNGVFKGATCSPAYLLPQLMIPHPASFVPLNLYNKYGLYDETFKSSGDWELFLRMYKSGAVFVYLDKIISHYDLGGISSTNIQLVEKENARLLKRWGEYRVSYKQRLFRMVISVYKLLRKVFCL